MTKIIIAILKIKKVLDMKKNKNPQRIID